MKFSSIAKGKELSKYTFYTSNRSRDFFFYCLSNLKKINIKKIIIPSYIGHTAKEGSGVMDAIIDSGLDYIFYPINKNLRINKIRLKSVLEEEDDETALLLIHYFGLIDPSYSSIIKLAEKKKIFIFDDCAHSYYTYYMFKDNFKGDAAFFSLHKLANNISPKSISLIKENKGKLFHPKINNLLNKFSKKDNYNSIFPLYSKKFDFFPTFNSIDKTIEKRFMQANIYKDYLEKSSYPIHILIPEESYKYPLQSFPILLPDIVDRDSVFQEMRNLDIQVVSLYYSLSNKVDKVNFPEAYYLSKKILNLPINEDLEKNQIIHICISLLKIIEKNIINENNL